MESQSVCIKLAFQFASSNEHLDLSSNQHGMETSLNQEDTPASFGNKIWSQNKDETSALIHAASQVLNVSLKK